MYNVHTFTVQYICTLNKFSVSNAGCVSFRFCKYYLAYNINVVPVLYDPLYLSDFYDIKQGNVYSASDIVYHCVIHFGCLP